MKAVDYTHGWRSKETKEDLFGELLNSEDTADAYEVSESRLYKKGRKYYWLQAEGCSCWEGDYYGYELTKTELLRLAEARSKDPDGYRGANHDKLMGVWVVENLGVKK